MFDKITEYLMYQQWIDCNCGNYMSQEEVTEYIKSAFIVGAFNKVHGMLENGHIQNSEDSYNLASELLSL